MSKSSSSSEETWELVSHYFSWFALLVRSFAIAGVVMLYTVEDPILINNSLKFENTKSGPVAVCCTNAYYGKSSSPSHLPYRLLDTTISLTVPETNYNSQRGNFMVKIEYISKKDEVAATVWHLMAVKFRSHHMLYLLSLLRTLPVLSSISSDTQVAKLILNNFAPGNIISCKGEPSRPRRWSLQVCYWRWGS